jgi:hypothetical protein
MTQCPGTRKLSTNSPTPNFYISPRINKSGIYPLTHRSNLCNDTRVSSILKIESARINGAKSRGPVTPAGKQASAANSAKSTGPTSPEGRARSAQNALRYGMLAQAVVLDTESSEEFAAVLARLTDELQPETGIETHMVEAMALAEWRIMRLWCIEREELANETQKQALAGCNGTGQNPAKCTALAYRALSDGSKSLDLINRHEARYERQYFRTLARLEDRRRKNKKIKKLKTN